MSSQRKRRLIAGGITCLVVALPSIWFSLQYCQVELDRALIASIRRSDDPAFDALLAKGANSNSRNNGRGTALGYAVVAGDIYEVKALIAAGAGINVKDPSGWIALKYANKHNHTEIASILRAAGAKD